MDRITKNGVSPIEYLNGGKREIDRRHYNERFAKKLLADHRLAQDIDFQNRYVNGYEFPAVPRFRQDAPSWDGFVRSWCESIVLEVSKKSLRSFLAKRFIEITRCVNLGPDWDSEDVRDWLRKSWEQEIRQGDGRKTVGERLLAYHVK